MLVAPTPTPKASLARVLEHLGTTLLDLVAGDTDGLRPISGVMIHDPRDADTGVSAGALVLGVGVESADDVAAVLATVADAGGAGLVVRAPAPVDPRIEDIAHRAGCALLALTPGASWNQLSTLLSSLLAEEVLGVGGTERLGGIPAGDLFGLANAVSALLDSPITIEDRSSRLLAFSNRQEEGDPFRTETILGRRVPEQVAERLEANGTFREMYRSDRPVFISHASLGLPGTGRSRAAIAVRAGEEILGSIWAVVSNPLAPAREQAMIDSAKLVAVHLLRLRAGADVERRLAADLVATALEGGPAAVGAAHRMGFAGRSSIVLAMGLSDEGVDRSAAGLARRELSRQQAADAFSLHLTAVHPGAAAALVGGVAYAILPEATKAANMAERAVAVATAFLERTGGRVPGLVGVGRIAADVTALAGSRADADRALRVLQSGRSTRRVARLSDVYIEALLLELGDHAEAAGDAPVGPVARLQHYDVVHRTRLLETLSAWLDAFGDVISAAEAVHVHPNSFRYRMRRIAEIGAIDLGDPEARFAAMLQLRVLRHSTS